MANASKLKISDHNYNLLAPEEGCKEDDLQAMEEELTKIQQKHTPVNSPNPKKVRTKDRNKQSGEITSEVQGPHV